MAHERIVGRLGDVRSEICLVLRARSSLGSQGKVTEPPNAKQFIVLDIPKGRSVYCLKAINKGLFLGINP